MARHGRDWTIAHTKQNAEGVCRINGCDETRTDPAHIVPRSLGGDMGADATIPLCREHHRQYDAHELDIGPFLTYAEQGEATRVLGWNRAGRQMYPSLFPKTRFDQ